MVIQILATSHLCTNIFEDRSHSTDPPLVTTAAGLSCIFLAQHADMLRARLNSTVVKGNSWKSSWIAAATLWWAQPQQSSQCFRHKDQPTSGAGKQSREHTTTLWEPSETSSSAETSTSNINRSLKWLKMGLVLVNYSNLSWDHSALISGLHSAKHCLSTM